MLPSSKRQKETRHTLFLDYDALYEPLDDGRQPAVPSEWNWNEGGLISLSYLNKHFHELVVFHKLNQYTELDATAYMETWVKRELQKVGIIAKFIQAFQFPRPEHILAQIFWKPSLRSWWIGNSLDSIQLGDALNLSTCLLFDPSWNKNDLERQNAPTPALISDCLHSFCLEFKETIANSLLVS